MSFLTDIQRVAEAKADLYTLLTAYGSTLSPNELINTYAAEFESLLSTMGSTNYYQCTAVSDDGTTWSGRRAVYVAGQGYEISDEEVSGLVYTGFVPTVGTIYNDNATVKVAELYVKDITAELTAYMEAAEGSSATAAADEQAVASALDTLTTYDSGLDEIIG